MSTFSPPPSLGEPDPFLELPKWPKVVGIISIVWGGFWIACGGCGLLMTAMTGPMLKMAAQQPQQPGGPAIGTPPDVMLPTPMDFLVMAAGVGTAALLLTAGIMLVRRSPAARMMHLLWALIDLPLLGLGAWNGWQRAQAQSDWAAQNPGTVWADQINQQGSFTMVMIAAFTIIGLIWPIFCLVWFLLIKPRAEQMGRAPEVVA